MQTSTGIDRRINPRFEVNDLVFVAFRPEFDKVGCLKDISRGGLSLEYTVMENQCNPVGKANIDIFDNSQSFRMLEVPCNIVHNTQVSPRECVWVSSIETRRCGIEFENLNPMQLAQLERALEKWWVRN